MTDLLNSQCKEESEEKNETKRLKRANDSLQIQ